MKLKNRIANLLKSPTADVKAKLSLFGDYVRIKHARKIASNAHNSGFTVSISHAAEEAANAEYYAYRDEVYEQHRQRNAGTKQR